MYLHPGLATTAAAAAAATLLLGGCGASDANRSSPSAQPAALSATGEGYLVKDYTFTPLTAAPGQTVRVLDGNDEPHTVTAEDGSFDTGPFDETDPGNFTAPTGPGT